MVIKKSHQKLAERGRLEEAKQQSTRLYSNNNDFQVLRLTLQECDMCTLVRVIEIPVIDPAVDKMWKR